jgi:hypothetical protein
MSKERTQSEGRTHPEGKINHTASVDANKPKFKLTKNLQKAILVSTKLLDNLNFFVETK